MEANNDTAIHFELLAERRAKEAAEDKLDAQRYRKLKAQVDKEQWDITDSQFRFINDLDAAVDALPMPGEKA